MFSGKTNKLTFLLLIVVCLGAGFLLGRNVKEGARNKKAKSRDGSTMYAVLSKGTYPSTAKNRVRKSRNNIRTTMMASPNIEYSSMGNRANAVEYRTDGVMKLKV